MYIYINEQEIIPYNGEILKRYAGNRLVKTIANPTDEDLSEFGYMPLVESETPSYDIKTQHIYYRYELDNNTIKMVWIVKENDDMTEEGGELENVEVASDGNKRHYY